MSSLPGLVGPNEMLLRDTEEGGDLLVLANTPPYDNAVNDLLLNLSVGAA